MQVQDTNQNFWHLTSILSLSLGIPGIVIGGYLSAIFGPHTAILSIAFGNFILWILGWCMIGMMQSRQNALQNIQTYLGNIGLIFATVVWVIEFLLWFSIQIEETTLALTGSFQGSFSLVIGLVLAFLCTVLSLGGIRIIKNIAVFCLPLFLIYLFTLVFQNFESSLFKSDWTFSIAGAFMIIFGRLPGTLNLPTFFRHAKSKSHAVFAWSLVMIFQIFLQSSCVFLNIQSPTQFFQKLGFGFFEILFVVLALTLSNLINIYYASSVMESAFPKFDSRWRFFLVGILGIISFLIFHPASFFLDPSNFSQVLRLIFSGLMANLAVVLFNSYIIRVIVRHRPKIFEKWLSLLAWSLGSSVTIYFELQNFEPFFGIKNGIIATQVFSLLIVFFAESFFSFKGLKQIEEK